jgi:hypothetical protein
VPISSLAGGAGGQHPSSVFTQKAAKSSSLSRLMLSGAGVDQMAHFSAAD